VNRIDDGRGAGPGTPADPVPLYHRVYLVLLQGISDRSFPPDRPMPPEAQLAELLGVSRITLRRAMERLEREKLVSRQRRRGTFPLPGNLSGPVQPEHLKDQISLSLRTKVGLLEHVLLAATPETAGMLNIKEGGEVLRVTRIRFDALSPISYSVCHLPGDLASLLPPCKIGSIPISALLMQEGLSLDKIDERLSACIASLEIARLLRVDVGSPLLCLTRTVRELSGRRVEHLAAFFRPDRYQYHVQYTGRDTDDSGVSIAGLVCYA
jgi:GntR family transcriptional regulator